MTKKNKSVDYYDNNSEEFVSSTVNLDMNPFYDAFLEHIPRGSCLLDVGCGSGRDLKVFKEKGYYAFGLDSSLMMTEFARKFSKCKVFWKNFDEINFVNLYSGIWACASLLHVPKKSMLRILKKLLTAGRKGCILYLSFKYGEGEGFVNERFFNNYTEKSFNKVIKKLDEIEWVRYTVTDDLKRPGLKWLNILMKKGDYHDQDRGNKEI